ncbi:MAG: hypothetical protein AAFN92_11450, partial [Bacteroidota bacterium]
MLSLFRTNQAYAGLFLLFYALLLQLPVLLGGGEPPPPATGGYLGSWILNWVGERPLLRLILPVVLVFVQGVLANTLVTRHRMSRTITQFPGLFLVLVWGLVPAFRWLHPIQLANVALLFGLLSLGRLYKKDEPAVPLFNAGAWLGVASLFYVQYLLFLPAFLVGVGVLRRPDLRSLIQLVTGLLLLYFLTGSWLYFRGTLATFLAVQFSGFTLVGLQFAGLPDQLGLGLLGFLLLVLLFGYGWLVRLLNIEGSKEVNIQYWLLLSTPLLLLFAGTATVAEAQTVVVPLGILLGLAFILFSKRRATLLHFLLLIAALLPG